MQITPENSVTEERLSLIEEIPANVIFTKVTGREEVSLHSHVHNRHQVIYILSGTLHVEVAGSSYFVTGRHLIWIPNGVEHRLSSNNTQISLLTSYFCLKDIMEDCFAIYKTDELVVRNLNFISTHEYVDKSRTPEIFAFAMGFFGVLPYICKEASFPAQPFIIPKDIRLLPVLDYIKANLNQDLSIEHVAFCFGFSVRNLTRLFTNSGIRFVHYLNYLRIVRAIEILTDNAMNIEQTAYEVGFNSPNSFGRVFKQITGESPSDYIKKR